MLAGKTTRDQATMLHGEFLIAPTWRANCQGGETCTNPQEGYPSGCRLIDGGSGPKSVSGSSWMNSELDENGKDSVVLDWFRPPESKTLRLMWWDYVEKSEVPLNGALGRLIWPTG
jgi:hypothetical protein